MEGELMCEMIGLRAVRAHGANRGLPPAHVEHITLDRSQRAQARHDWIAKYPRGPICPSKSSPIAARNTCSSNL